MAKLLILICLHGFIFSSINGQVIDFNRIANQVIPILNNRIQDKGLLSNPKTQINAGILLQQSQWMEVKTKYSSDLLIYIKDKNQYFSIWYSSPSYRNTEIKFEYFKKISPLIILGTQLGNIKVNFNENQRQNIISIGMNGIFIPHVNHQVMVKYEKKIGFIDSSTNHAFLIGAESRVNQFISLNFFYIHPIGNRSKGLCANIKGTYNFFVGEIGWEPLPYSLTGGLAYILPKNNKFGISFRHHQWLGMLNVIYFQKQWNMNSK
jgi:hypothetical protein